MNQRLILTTMLDLIAKNCEDPNDRLDIPLALYITACKINNVSIVIAAQAVIEAFDDINVLIVEPSDAEVKTH